VLPTLFHAPLPLIAAAASVTMEAAEENLREKQETESLPEGDQVPTEDGRQKSIPQALDHEAENGGGYKYDNRNFQSS
jgi:hypothetical protein